MNNASLVTRKGSGNLPQWSPGAPGYIALETGGGAAGANGDGARRTSQLWTAFGKYWWVVLLIWALVAVPASIAAYKYIPPQYVAKGGVEVQPFVQDTVKGTKDPNPFFEEYLRTQAEMMKNPFVLQRAAQNVRLQKYAWFRALPDQVRYLDENVVVSVVAQDIYVSMTYKDPEASTAIVDSVIDAYFRARGDLDTQSIDKQLEILTSLQGTTDKALKDAQEKLVRLQKDGGAAWSDDDRKVVTELVANGKTTLAQLQGKQIELQAERDSLAARKAPDEVVYKASVQTDSDPDIDRWRAAQSQVQMADNVLASKHATYDHPDRVENRRQLKVLADKIASRRDEIRDRSWNNYIANYQLDRTKKLQDTDSDLAGLKEQMASLTKRIGEQEQVEHTLADKMLPIKALEDQVADAKSALARYDDRIETIKNETKAPGRVTALGPTVEPRSPNAPRWPKVAAAANGGGLFLGFIVLVILMKLRNKIDVADDLPEQFQPLVVGSVSHAAMVNGTAQDGTRRRIMGEEMQLLHANLLPPGKSERRIMMITSPTPSNGKTSIASHLALSLAKSGLEVLLIDGDLRKRDLTTMFDLGFRPGLSDLLQGNPPELVRPMELLPNLRVMGAGSKLERSPVELLQRKHFHEALGLLHENFDCIVVDTPPALILADARLIARSCDEVLCVVRANLSSPREVNQTLEALARITGKTPKIVVNAVSHRQSHYKYKYDYTKSTETADAAVTT